MAKKKPQAPIAPTDKERIQKALQEERQKILYTEKQFTAWQAFKPLVNELRRNGIHGHNHTDRKLECPMELIVMV